MTPTDLQAITEKLRAAREKATAGNRLTRIGRPFHVMSGNERKLSAVYECQCGAIVTRDTASVACGKTRSCGCLRRELLTTHGVARSLTYRSWRSMIERCYSPSHNRYHRYGGRGIVVCERWKDSIAAFIEDMGPRPSRDHSIDRKNNDGNYEPGNCRWATRAEQSHNLKRTQLLTIDGRTMSVKEWARQEDVAISDTGIRNRLRRGMSARDAVFLPDQSNRRPRCH